MNTMYVKIENDWKEHFMGYSALAIILSTTVGSMAVLTTMMQGNGVAQMIQLFFVVTACSIHNASIISVQKPTLVLKLLGLSLAISILVMLSGLIYLI